MNLREMNYVVAIYEEQSISKAAERLYISQPSLSKFLINLERELNAQLFDRTTNPLTPTEYGRAYIETARSMLNLNSDMLRRMEDIRNYETGLLRIGMSVVRSAYYIPMVLPEFHRRFPGIQISLEEESATVLEQHLLQGRLDVAITSGIVMDPQINCEVIRRERIYFAVPRGYVKGADDSCKFGDVAPLIPWKQTRFVLLHKQQRVRQIADQVFADYGLEPQVIMETKITDTALKLCAKGMCCAFVSEVTKEDPFYRDMEADYYELDERYSLPVIAACRRGAYIPQSVRYFLQILNEGDGRA